MSAGQNIIDKLLLETEIKTRGGEPVTKKFLLDLLREDLPNMGGGSAGAAGGDLDGTYPNPDVLKIRGIEVDLPVAQGMILIYDGAGAWIALDAGLEGEVFTSSSSTTYGAGWKKQASPYCTSAATSLTQSGITDPSSLNLFSEFAGVTITWTRTGIGQYFGTASAAIFTAGKTFVTVSSFSSNRNDRKTIETIVFSTTQVVISTFSEDGQGLLTEADELLFQTKILIEVYP